jgi:outer membrane protein OmpA-like peptidoglycan-associated protein
MATFMLSLLAGCSVNPFSPNNEFTGTATGTLIGAGVGGGTAALVGASKVEIGAAAIVGGALGYYATSLPFISGGITHVGGKVYTLGEYATIEIPTDSLFDTNTSDFLPEAPAILDSAIAVLNRYPHDNIMISGNTNGFYTARFERKMSEDRARQVAAYLWAHGISNDNATNPNENYGGRELPKRFTRDLSYVGYGSHFPISNTITAQGVRENSRIQITAYPYDKQLEMNKCSKVVKKVSNENEQGPVPRPTSATLNEDSPVTGDTYPNESHAASGAPEAGENDYRGESWESYVDKHPYAAKESASPVGCSTGSRHFKGE